MIKCFLFESAGRKQQKKTLGSDFQLKMFKKKLKRSQKKPLFYVWQTDTKSVGEVRNCVGEMKQSAGEMKQTVGETKQFVGDLKQI